MRAIREIHIRKTDGLWRVYGCPMRDGWLEAIYFVWRLNYNWTRLNYNLMANR